MKAILGGEDVREIKFRYRLRNLATGEAHFTVVTLEGLEVGKMLNLPRAGLIIDARDEWTGLHDKNGREIYEGDILRHDDPNWGYGGAYDKEHDGYLRTIVPSLDVLLRDGLDDGNYEPQFMQHWEIIGNIHEHGDSLK